jgi:hypothetical protein
MDAAAPTRLVLWVTVDQHGTTWFSVRPNESAGDLDGDELVPFTAESGTAADVAVYSRPAPPSARSHTSAHPRGWLWTAAIAAVIAAGLLVSLHGRPSAHRSSNSAPAASLLPVEPVPAPPAPVAVHDDGRDALVDDVVMGLRPESVLVLRPTG